MRRPTGRQNKLVLSVSSLLCFCLSCFVCLKLVRQIQSGCKTEKIIIGLPDKILDTFRNYSKTAQSKNDEKKTEIDFREIVLEKTWNHSKLNRTDYFECEDFHHLPDTFQAVKENLGGNRGISFIKINLGGHVIDVVYKEVSKYFQTIGDDYKYNNALKEIEYLTKLKGLTGVPQIFGSCIEKTYIGYFVERIKGKTICNDNGTSAKCAKATHLLSSIAESRNPKLSALQFAYHIANLFKQLEERHLFLEDLSGVNLMFDENFKVYLVDADSLIFYNKKRLFSDMICESDQDCLGPTGNLWLSISLNSKIYVNCLELKGICFYSKCRGFDNSLHACGIAEWLLCRLSQFFESDSLFLQQMDSICKCLQTPHPMNRCGFSFAMPQYEKLLKIYLKSQ